MTKPVSLKIAGALLAVLNTMDVMAAASAPLQSIELYFAPKTKQIVTEPGKNRIKLSAFQSAESLEQKKQELAAIENRLDAKMKSLDEKLKQLEKMESAPAIATASPEEAESAPPVQTTQDKKSGETEAKSSEKLPVRASYGDKGFELKTKDGRFVMQIQNRLQFRYANPFDSDPRSLADLDRDQSSFMVRRARFKVARHAYSNTICNMTGASPYYATFI